MRELHERVHELETYVKIGVARSASSDVFHTLKHAAITAKNIDITSFKPTERALLRGKGFKTQYFGPTNGASLLLQFEELSRFVKDIIHRMPTLEKHRAMWKQTRKESSVNFMLPEIETLASLVPDRARADALVQEYFETLETTYRVLHAPTFFQKYKNFWLSSSTSSPAFLVQLLLVCASMHCSVEGGPRGFIGRSSACHDAALKWIDLCQTWFDLQSQKHMTLDVFQIRVLLLIAKKLNSVKLKREWVFSGDLLRQAMSSGLHREPTFLSDKLTPFDQEMRRRLWYTIVELDLQNSVDRGMTCSVGSQDWDTLPPLNLHDEDFDESTEKLPPARSLMEFTRTSFLCLAQQHLPLRLETLSRLNSLRPGIEADTTIELDQRFRQILDNVPAWSDTAAVAMSGELSRLLLYQFVLLIHQPFAAYASAQAQYFYSRAARRSAALASMKIVTELRSSSGQTLCSLRDDLFRACLATCHDISLSLGSRDDMMQDRSLAVELVEQSVDLMEERIRNLGQGFHSYWLSCSALGLLRSKLLPEEPAEKFAQATADRVAVLHGYMMAQQVGGTPSGISLEDVALSTANTLVGMSGNQPGASLPELDAFVTTTADPFTAFSETLFDFDITDLWNIGGGTQQY